MNNQQAQLIAERYRRGLELLAAQLEQEKNDALHRIEFLEARLHRLEETSTDHEQRLRTLADAVVRLSTSGSLVQMGQAALSVILAALAAYLGSR